QRNHAGRQDPWGWESYPAWLTVWPGSFFRYDVRWDEKKYGLRWSYRSITLCSQGRWRAECAAGFGPSLSWRTLGGSFAPQKSREFAARGIDQWCSFDDSVPCVD